MRTADLIAANVRTLMQAREVLARIEDETYAQAAPGTNGIRIGAHIRHVVETYECFLTGMGQGIVDYDCRRRNGVVETSPATAVHCVDCLVRQLQQVARLRIDLPLSVRAEDASVLLSSTIGRELQVLMSHTIHHFAMVAVALHASGIEVDPDFGVAPSTLRYRSRAREAA
jgi:hypothetical protein